MKKVSFGNSGLELSQIGLGMAALGRPGYINLGHGEDLHHDYSVESMMSHAHSVLDQAYDLGIRYFDMARSYGRAEYFFNQWLQKKNPAEIICGSKWGYTYTADWAIDADVHEVKDHRLEVLQRQWQETKENLGHALNIYHIHSATLESGVLDDSNVIRHLWGLKERGTIIGLSLSGVAQSETLLKALNITSEGVPLFGSVQLTYNILEPSVYTMIQKAFDVGLGVIIKESLANGRLSDRNNEPSFSESKKVLSSIAQNYNVGIDAVAIAYIKQQPWPSVILSGASNREQLVSNVRASSLELDKSDLQRLSLLKEPSESYWKTRSCLAWN